MLFSKAKNLKKGVVIILFLSSLLTLLPLSTARASVGLMYFRAVDKSSYIMLEWETAQETNNLGFDLYRGTTDDRNQAQKLNSSLIPAQSGGATGAFYQWPDYNVQIGVQYYYWIVDWDTSNNPTEHDPATGMANGGNSIPTVPSGGGSSTNTHGGLVKVGITYGSRQFWLAG